MIDRTAAKLERGLMRWDHLFADLDARFEEIADEQMLAELADRQRAAAGQVVMVQRLGGAVGEAVRIRVATGQIVPGILGQVGPDWVLLRPPSGAEVVIALRWITSVEGVVRTTGMPLSQVERRFDLRLALRGIARDRSPVAMTMSGQGAGTSGASAELTGTIDRIGFDFLELAQHAAWEPRRAADVRSVALIPIAAVVMVRPVPLG